MGYSVGLLLTLFKVASGLDKGGVVLDGEFEGVGEYLSVVEVLAAGADVVFDFA